MDGARACATSVQGDVVKLTKPDFSKFCWPADGLLWRTCDRVSAHATWQPGFGSLGRIYEGQLYDSSPVSPLKRLLYMLRVGLAVIAGFGLVEAQSRFTPSGNYTPTFGECPTGHTFVRPASDGLNDREKNWRAARNWQVKYALSDYLRNVGIEGFKVDEYIDALHEEPEKVPVIAISFSGGGTRAQLCELGLYQGLDARHQPSLDAKTGGLLQATTYISGCQFCPYLRNLTLTLTRSVWRCFDTFRDRSGGVPKPRDVDPERQPESYLVDRPDRSSRRKG